MLILDGLLSTLQSSLQTIYGLVIGSVAVFNGKNGKQINTSSSSSSSLQENDTIDSSSVDCGEIRKKDLKSVPNTKSGVDRIITDGLACWHFLATLGHIIKRAVAVKIYIVKPDKVVLNQRRVINLSSRLHETIFKNS